MRVNSALLLVPFFIICCCTHKPFVNIQTYGKITLIDSSAFTDSLLPYNSSQRFSLYPVFYIGKIADTFKLGLEPIQGFQSGLKDYRNAKNITYIDSNKMTIYVDTNINLTYTFNILHYPTPKGQKTKIDSSKSWKAFPVFVYNNCDSLLNVGIIHLVYPMVRQVKNKNGEWQDIEAINRGYCGTGIRILFIEPHQVAIAKLIRYKGDYKISCRLKFTEWGHTVYSNTFTDYVDKRELTDALPVFP